MGDQSANSFEAAKQQFEKIADMLDLDKSSRNLLRTPTREYHFSIPVRMDDGTIEVFRGFRIQHNDARGPCKGGIRFQPRGSVDTLRAMAMLMTWKCSIMDLPLGGSKGGVICDPHNLSAPEQERLCRGWIRQLARNIGPLSDVPAPDLMTNPQHMLWMLDEYEMIQGDKFPGVITGKPVGMGGSQGRIESSGYGLVYALREALKELNVRPSDTTASVQGFGNVAQYAIELYHQIGGKVTCVSCWDQEDGASYAYRKEDGIDLEELRSITDPFGDIHKEEAEELGYEVLPGASWIAQAVDILIPAAVENEITAATVGKIHPQVKIIAEGANSPTTPEADEVLKQRNVFVIPDLLASAGGVTSGYFEQVQCNMNYYWDKDEVLGKLDQKMTSAFIAVSEIAHQNKLYMRDAAYVIAISRVARACRDRGWV